jgi:hypothetical protein
MPRILALIAFVGVALAASGAGHASKAPAYTRAATESCLARLPDAVVGLPPASPPVPPVLFVSPLAHEDWSTWGTGVRRPRPHTQLGVWQGARRYEGIILSFFASVADARATRTSRGTLYGSTLRRNVLASWDQSARPSRGARATVFACLRSKGGPTGTPRRAPRATLATFAGAWGGHTRRLLIAPGGRASEITDSGCCVRAYTLTFRIRSVSGTLTHAVATYRVTSYRRGDMPLTLRAGDVGKLTLKNGIVTNTLTRVYFCSDPAWGATGACGA